MSDIDHNKAVRQITDALKGPVAAVFRKLVPAFADLKGAEFYDAVVASSELLHGCLLIFRKRRDAFAALLVDAKGRVVSDDFVRLKCGRSVHDIIGMIVRTHAKKHFRTALGGDPNDPRSKSGRLYQAMNEYLIHEWQVPLVPHYAPMSPAKAAEMGPLLLELKSAAQVDAVVASTRPPHLRAVPSAPPPSEPAPSTPKTPEPVLVESHSREEDYWWETLADPHVRLVLGNMSESDRRELTATFCQLCEATRTQLLAPLGLSLYQAAVVLTVCYRNMGRAAFGQIFGKPGNANAVAALAGKLKAKNITSRTDLAALARLVEGVLATMPRAAARPVALVT